MELDAHTMENMWSAIDVIEAREALLQMKIGDYVKHMKKRDRNKFHREIFRKAFPKSVRSVKYTDSEQLNDRLVNG